MVPSRPRRRWLSYSLRMLLLVVTLLAIVLGYWANSALEQRRALATIHGSYPHNHTMYTYEWEEMRSRFGPGTSGVSTQPTEPHTWAPRWLREWLGKDFFFDTDSVCFGERLDGGPQPTAEEDRATWKALSGIASLRQLTSYIGPLDEDLGHIARLRRLKWIDLHTCSQLTDEGLRSLGRLPQLEHLTLSGGQYTPAGFKRLAGLRHLKDLGLVSWWTPNRNQGDYVDPIVRWLGSDRAVEVTDEDLAEIGQMVGLEELRLVSSRVTDAGLAHLARLTNLRKLELGAPNVTAAGFEQLARLPNLEHVKLYCPGLSDDGLRFVAAWPQLKSLELYGATIEGSGFEHFAPKSKLEFVSIFEGPNVTDAVIPPLAHLVNLLALQLHGTRITGANLAELQSAPKLISLSITPAVDVDMAELRSLLPKCRILRIGDKSR